MIGALLAKIGLDMTLGAIRDRLRTVPWQVWAGLGAIGLLVLAVLWHRGAVQDHYDSAYAAGKADAETAQDAALAQMRDDARAWRGKYESAAGALAARTKELNDVEARAIAYRADDLRLRGPGQAAACSRSGAGAGSAAGAGGDDAAGGAGDAALAGVPAEQPLALVPWGDLVQYAENADLDRSEVLSWRSWYREQQALLATARQALEGDAGE